MQPPPKQRKFERTKARIAQAATALFAANGYERTSVRDIAAAAEIDPAMVLRYFGSKEALFTEVATFSLNLPDLTTVERETVGETLVRHYLSVWEGDSKGLQILLRSAPSNEVAATRMREVFAGQVLPTIAKVAPDRPAERAALVGTQLLGLGLTRYLLKLPPMVNMPSERLITELGHTLQGYIFH
ncbi:TetR/AcrR family transcriptional regulator [Amorphus sp. MBR-141]